MFRLFFFRNYFLPLSSQAKIAEKPASLFADPALFYDFDFTPFFTDYTANVPDMVFVTVFRYLPKKDILIQCAPVSQKFYRCSRAETLWQCVNLKGHRMEERILMNFVAFGIKVLHLAQTEVKALRRGDEFVAFHACLQSLTLSFIHSGEMINRLLKCCNRLVGLSLDRCQLSDETCASIGQNKSMKVLDLSSCALTLSGMKFILYNCKQLVEFNLNVPQRLPDALATVKFAISKMPATLEKLEFWGNYTTVTQDIVELISRCPNLTEFALLGNCRRLDVSTLKFIVENLPKLETFRCFRWKLVKTNDFRVCENLKKLNIVESRILSTDDKDCLARNYLNLELTEKYTVPTVANPSNWHPAIALQPI